MVFAPIHDYVPMYRSHIVDSNALWKTHLRIRYATFDKLLTVYATHFH